MIDDKMAKMAVNTIDAYCVYHVGCNNCEIRDNCRGGEHMTHPFACLRPYPDIDTFGNMQKPSEKLPKFDITLKDSTDFREYINEIFMREAEKAGLPMNTANSIKWFANGKIKLTFVDDGNKTNYIGVAKCHPDDAFNPEIGIKLAIERAAQVMHAMNDMNKYERTIPKAGEKWMHFKGHVYEIIGFGNHTERMELVVIYQEAGDCTYWVRPLEKFMSKVDHNKYPDEPYKWRFWKVSDAEQ